MLHGNMHGVCIRDRASTFTKIFEKTWKSSTLRTSVTSEPLTLCKFRLPIQIRLLILYQKHQYFRIFKDFPVLIGQKFTFSCLGKKTYQEALQIIPELLGPMETIYIHMPEDGNPVPLTGLSLEELKSLVCSKISSESQPIISEGEFNKLRKKLSVRLTIDLKENIRMRVHLMFLAMKEKSNLRILRMSPKLIQDLIPLLILKIILEGMFLQP